MLNHRSAGCRDPFVYRDCRGGYHMLAHSIAPRQKGRVGVHSHSRDGVKWTMGKPAVAYTTNVTWTDGSTSTLARRERPVLVFGDAKAGGGTGEAGGCKWVPIALSKFFCSLLYSACLHAGCAPTDIPYLPVARCMLRAPLGG